MVIIMKKFLCVFIAIVILIPPLFSLQASADTSGSIDDGTVNDDIDVNLWTYDMFGQYWDKDDLEIMPDPDF